MVERTLSDRILAALSQHGDLDIGQLTAAVYGYQNFSDSQRNSVARSVRSLENPAGSRPFRVGRTTIASALGARGSDLPTGNPLCPSERLARGSRVGLWLGLSLKFLIKWSVAVPKNRPIRPGCTARSFLR